MYRVVVRWVLVDGMGVNESVVRDLFDDLGPRAGWRRPRLRWRADLGERDEVVRQSSIEQAYHRK